MTRPTYHPYFSAIRAAQKLGRWGGGLYQSGLINWFNEAGLTRGDKVSPLAAFLYAHKESFHDSPIGHRFTVKSGHRTVGLQAAIAHGYVTGDEHGSKSTAKIAHNIRRTWEIPVQGAATPGSTAGDSPTP